MFRPEKFKIHRGAAESAEKTLKNGMCEMRSVRVKLLSEVGRYALATSESSASSAALR
jgi:hypothetical protein